MKPVLSLRRGLLLLLVVAAACSTGNVGGDDTPPIPGEVDARAMQQVDCVPSCNSAQLCCDIAGTSACINGAGDMNNCGSCGNRCDLDQADSCGGGLCKCGFSPSCTGDSTCCPLAGCKNLMTDPANCGECGHACGAGAVCTGGECTCGGNICGAGEACCGGDCVSTTTDPANCGACGMVCSGMASACNGGICGCAGGGGACPTGMGVLAMCCGTGCIDVCADPMNCGGCGAACAIPGDMCLFGTCFLSGGGSPNPACIGLMP